MLTMMSMEPKPLSVAMTSFSGKSGAVVSPGIALTAPPSLSMIMPVSKTTSRSRSFNMTDAPAAASFCATARPMPRPAPVTSAVLPFRSIAMHRVLSHPMPVLGSGQMRLLILPLLFLATTLFATESAERTVGSATAPVTLDVYSDFQCPHCARLHFGALKEALGDCVASGKVRIVYHDFPLPQHQYARKAAQYAGAGARIGRYERICDTIFKNQDAWGQTGDIESFVSRELTAPEMA